MLEYIIRAAENIDWRYVRLSRLDYDGTFEPVRLGDPHWLARPFAYELYHQVRCLANGGVFEMECVVQAEVLKTYQEIRDLEKMPDLLFHVPDSTNNLAVVEVKLAANSWKSLQADLKKLVLFRRVLQNETLVEVVVGTAAELNKVASELDVTHDPTAANAIEVLLVEFGSPHVRNRVVTIS